MIDCSTLTFIDSSSIVALLEAHRILETQERRMVIVNIPPTPRRVFEILGLTDLVSLDHEHEREHAT